MLQIEGLRTQTSSRAAVDAVHAGLVLPSGGPGLAASSGIGTGEHSVGNRLHSSSAHHPTGMLHSHVRLHLSHCNAWNCDMWPVIGAILVEPTSTV